MEIINPIIDKKVPVLVAFSTETCGPCKVLAQVLDQIEQELGSKIHIERIDVDKDKMASIQFGVNYQIKGTPSMLFFKDGKLCWKHFGVLFKEELLDKVNPFIE